MIGEERMEFKTKYNLYDKVVFKERFDGKVLKGEIYSIRMDVRADKDGKELYEIMAEDGFFHWCKIEEIWN